MSKLERVTPELAAETLAFLALRPYENVYIAWLLETGQIARGAGTLVAWRDNAGAIEAVCFAGSQIVIAAGETLSENALRALVAFAATACEARGIVGPRRAIEPLWQRLRPAFRPARLERPSQPVYALTRASLRGGRRDAVVDRATRADLDELVVASAQMMRGEIGIDPRTENPDFRGRTARIIDAGWWWRYRALGRLAFTCNVGSATDYTAQIQGVWTPPAMRGRGYATRGLAAICDHLLDEFATLSLYVNDFNVDAIELYERVGFARTAEFTTILL